MRKRDGRVKLAQETLAIIEAGGYAHPQSGAWVDIGETTRVAKRGTELIKPESLGPTSGGDVAGATAVVTVANETTFAAARRMAEGGRKICSLNFASAKHPGGSFLKGTKAQEEDLAYASSLDPCLLEAPEYYEVNRACGTELYTDLMIYSPGVPVFRDDEGQLLDEPWTGSIITCPAPKAGSVRKNEPDRVAEIEPTLERRIYLVLEAAKRFGERRFVLGAWGCGVFRNDPKVCARFFREALASPAFASAFDCIHFAVLDRADGLETYREFEEAFADWGSK